MGTVLQGLDAFESEIAPRPQPSRSTPFSGTTGVLTSPARLRDSPPVVRVAIAGVPSWARGVPLVPAIAFVLTATAGISVALSLLLLRF